MPTVSKAYKYIYFKLIEQKSKTGVYECCAVSNSGRLGIVKWHCTWRQYCYFPVKDTLYSQGCIEDITDFLKKLREERSDR